MPSGCIFFVHSCSLHAVNFSELKMLDCIVVCCHMQGLAIQNGYMLLIIRLSTQAMGFYQKVLHLLNSVRTRVLPSLDLQHLPSVTWVIKGTNHVPFVILFLSFFFFHDHFLYLACCNCIFILLIIFLV